MRVGIATDHGGFDLKEELVKQLQGAGHDVVDFGAHDLRKGDDYPDYVLPLAQAVAAQEVERGGWRFVEAVSVRRSAQTKFEASGLR
jgi:ribose 5-phosphate isomerase B